MGLSEDQNGGQEIINDMCTCLCCCFNGYRYSSLQYSDMMKLPIRRLVASHALIVMWTTNHPKHIEFVKTTLFSHWSIKFKAEWHWMKARRR
jgi:N6-adenosine-specific RNA methylase IME4